MLHDAAFGSDSVAHAAAGDEIRFKAEATDRAPMFLDAWHFQGKTAQMMALDEGGWVVLLLEDDRLDEGTWIVDGLVKGRMAYDGQSVAVVETLQATAPLIFA